MSLNGPVRGSRAPSCLSDFVCGGLGFDGVCEVVQQFTSSCRLLLLLVVVVVVVVVVAVLVVLCLPGLECTRALFLSHLRLLFSSRCFESVTCRSR